MALRELVAAASDVVAIPTTNVGNPAVRAALTAFWAPTSSVMLSVLVPPAQLGSPSVARSKYLGLGSASPVRYFTALFITGPVGVPSAPLKVSPLSAAWIAEKFEGPTSTTGAVAAPHWVGSAPRNMRPQLTLVSVCCTTWLSAAMTSDHFEVAPQWPLPLPA